MKIAQIIIGYHPIVGGYGRHVNLISSELRKRGHKVEILSTKFSPSNISKEKGVIRFWNDPFVKFTPGLFFHLIKNNYDIIHVHGYPSFQPWIASFARKFKKFPLIFTPHYHPFGNKPGFIRKLFDVFFGRPALKEASRIIALTQFEKNILSNYVDKNKISIVPNPIPLSRLKKIKGFKKKHNIGKYVLFVGRLEKDKGINYLIDAVDDMDIVIIGKDVGFGSKIKKRKNVHILGQVSDRELMAAYTECSLLVMPSKYEAFGITFIEAMAYGKPVIGTKVGPVPSIIGKAGLTIPYGNVVSLRKAINKILKNPYDFKKAGLRQVKEYDVKKVVDKLEEIYDKYRHTSI